MSLLFWLFPAWLVWLCFGFGFVSLVTYLGPLVYQSLAYRRRDFRKFYGAQWALVTGGSSGIGRSLVERLARQQINVVVVALDDALLAAAIQELRAKFPLVRFVPVGVNLGATDPETYMKPIREATARLPQLRLVFNNAGFILPGIFERIPLAKHMVNLNCNATAAVCITHHFLQLWMKMERAGEGQKRGLITFTSSSAGFLPSPIAALYGATKTFLTSFASAVATEMQEDGIDVVCVHPSPINSNFYQNASGIGLLTCFQKTALSPDVITDTIFKAAGRCTVRDQGYFSIGTKLMLKAVDWNFMGELSPVFMKNNADFRKLKGAVGVGNVKSSVGGGVGAANVNVKEE